MSYIKYLDEKFSLGKYQKLNNQTFKNISLCGKGFVAAVDGPPDNAPSPTPDATWAKDSLPLKPEKCTRQNEEAEETKDKSKMDSGFIVKLIDYLETTFPSYGKLDANIKSELKNVLDVGTDEKMKEIDRVKKKVNDVIAREKKRFLDRVSTKIDSIAIKPVEDEPVEEEGDENAE